MSGILSQNEFAHAALLPGDSAMVQFYPSEVTSRMRRER